MRFFRSSAVSWVCLGANTAFALDAFALGYPTAWLYLGCACCSALGLLIGRMLA